MSSDLNFRSRGEGSEIPTVALHGLLASLQNWESVSRRLSEAKQFIAVDLPNHGKSFHCDEMSYESIIHCFDEWVNEQGFKVIDLMGHSFGGKISMLYALTYPEKVRKLIIEDIAPKEYPARYTSLMEAMLELDLASLKTRAKVDEKLTEKIPNRVLRGFLLTNLAKSDDSLVWRANLKTLMACGESMRGFPAEGLVSYKRPALFVYGEKSEYVSSADEGLIRKIFPSAALHPIANAGHWVHAEKTDEFCELVDWFLKI